MGEYTEWEKTGRQICEYRMKIKKICPSNRILRCVCMEKNGIKEGQRMDGMWIVNISLMKEWQETNEFVHPEMEIYTN